MRRRDALVIGGAMAVAVAIPPFLRQLPSDFEFTPMDAFPGFRRLAAGAMTGGDPLFFGLGDQPENAVPAKPSNLCAALFKASSWSADPLPIAVFSDVNCPYCRVLEKTLIDLRQDGEPVRLIWHELPLLGPSSVRAARAVLAAKRQGVHEPAHRYVMSRNLRPGSKSLTDMALYLNLDPVRLRADVSSVQIDNDLARSLALGSVLGIPGTPGIVVGRTLVIGAISRTDLQKLIRMERDTPFEGCA